MTSTSPKADPGPKPADPVALPCCSLCHQPIPTAFYENDHERRVGVLTAATVSRDPRRIERSPAASSNELHTAIAASDVGAPLSADRPSTRDERRRGDGSVYAEDAMEAIEPEPFCKMTGPAGTFGRQVGMAGRALGASLAAVRAWGEARRAERDYTKTTFEKANAARANAEKALDDAARMLLAWEGGLS